MDLIGSLGAGDMSESAYDTAWVARVPAAAAEPDAPRYPAAYDWLLRNQLTDGSWGGAIPSAHDRVVTTLAALLTLQHTTYRRTESEPAIRRAIIYLNREGGKVRDDPDQTVGFELVLPEMVREAQALGLRLPYADWEFVEQIRADKLRRIPPVAIYGGPTPLTHSLEYLGQHLVLPLASRCRLPNGSYGVSPSTTAYVCLQVADAPAMAYLDRVTRLKPSGGVPYVHPFDVFETAWVAHLLGALANDHDRLPAMLDGLEKALTPLGAAWTVESSVTDADDTAVAVAVLTDHGRTCDTSVFELFETSEYFQTFAYERDASVTTNAHVLMALRKYPSTPEQRRMILKIMQFLRTSRHPDGYWHDKWHISPYYATDQVVEALSGVATDLIRPAVGWVMAAQQENGAWGFGDGTQEETAWAMHTLLVAGDHDPGVRALANASIDRGVEYLFDHFGDQSYPSLWIGKSAYTPPNIVRAVILGVLSEGLRRAEGGR